MKHDTHKRLFHDPENKRKELIHLLEDELAGCSEVIFAYLFGSLLEAIPYEDIDIGVFVSSADERRMQEILLDLQMKLSKKIGRPIDIRPLNTAPVGFLYHVFRGRLLLDRDEELRVSLIEKVIMRYLDMKPLMERSLKEAMTRE